MTKHSLYLVSILIEPSLKERIISGIQELGAKEYIIVEINGEGTTGVHGTDLDSTYLKIETIVTHEVSEDIFKFIYDNYLHNYGLITYRHAVDVIRSEKF